MHILFYDVASPAAFNLNTLKNQPVRGSEASTIRIAHELSKRHQVSIAHHFCVENKTLEGVNYIDIHTAHQSNPDIVILLRNKQHIEPLAVQFPDAKLFFWMHNLPPKDLIHHKKTLITHQYEIIAVSHYHAATIKRRLKTPWYQRLIKQDLSIPIHTLYNPVEDHSDVQATLNPNQLLFASSPYKGLDESIMAFNRLKQIYPEYQLKVILPEELISDYNYMKGVSFTPCCSNRKLAQHMKESFCVFYPQAKRVETFGLIYAEANAVGTPVLAHDFGAAREVLSNPSQLIDGRNQASINDKIHEWRERRPSVGMRDAFKLESVISNWHKILER